MATTVSALNIPDTSFYSLATLNAYFTELESVLNGKLDVREMQAPEGIQANSISIINLPPPAVGEPVREE